MDRRYAEMSFGDAKASDTGKRRSEALARRYLEAARKQNSLAQSRGGGAASRSGDSFGGESVSAMRAEEAQDKSQVFEEAGSALSGQDSFTTSRNWRR